MSDTEYRFSWVNGLLVTLGAKVLLAAVLLFLQSLVSFTSPHVLTILVPVFALCWIEARRYVALETDIPPRKLNWTVGLYTGICVLVWEILGTFIAFGLNVFSQIAANGGGALLMVFFTYFMTAAGAVVFGALFFPLLVKSKRSRENAV